MGFEVRLGDLERGSSSNVGGEGAEVNTATSAPSHVPLSSHPPTPAVPCPFHVLKEKFSLKIEVFSKFRDRFQFPEETRARLPKKVRRLAPSLTGNFVFTRLHFRAASDSPSIHLSWSFFTT